MDISHKNQTNKHQCNECDHKSLLINKYLHLIQLLKKKKQKINKSNTLSHKNSIIDGLTLSVAPFDLLSQSDQKYKLIELLSKLQYKKILNAFKSITKQPKNVKLALLIIMNKHNKVLRYKGFNALKRADFHENHNSYEAKLEELQTISKIKKEQIQFQSLQNHNSDNKLPKLKEIIKIMGQNFKNVNQFLKKSSKTNFSNKFYKFQSNLLRQNYILKLQQKELKIRIQYLQKELQQNIRRQFKQSQKKKQSLEMLAEDIAEKNQIIIQLQNIVKSYECRINKSDDVLEDQYQTMRKEVEQLQKVNEKLEFDAMKFKDKSESLSLRLNQSQIKYQKLVLQNQKLKYKIFDLRKVQQQNQNSLKQTKQIINHFKDKINQLKIKEIQVNERVKKITQIQNQMISLQIKFLQPDSRKKIQNTLQQIQSQFDKQIKSTKSVSLEQIDNQSKVIAIFSFLKTLTSSHKQIQYGNQKCISLTLKTLLSKEQEKIINDHMKMFKQNHNITCYVRQNNQQKQYISSERKKIKVSKTEQNFFNNKEKQKNKAILEQSDEIIHGQQDLFDSILDIIKNNNQEQDQLKNRSKDKFNHLKDFQYPDQELISNNLNTIKKKSKPNLTLKLLQMELQKTNLVQKISQLKNKYMHIRNMVFNLMKSLKLCQLNLQNRSQTFGILQVIFDVFQYSQQQKQEIFSIHKKKKKFFNIFQ